MTLRSFWPYDTLQSRVLSSVVKRELTCTMASTVCAPYIFIKDLVNFWKNYPAIQVRLSEGLSSVFV